MLTRQTARYLKIAFAALVLIPMMAMAGCASGNCRKNRMDDGINPAAAPVETGRGVSEAQMATKPTDRLRVFKYDGSLQCNQGKVIPIESMKAELEGIQVFASETKSDNQMHIQRCGALTGKAHVFEIDRKDLDQAKKQGFSLWTFD